MLFEIFRYFTAKASEHARELGYLKESIAFEARAQRHWKMWQPHFEQARSLILSQTQNLPKNTVIWILGSGSLYETPWKEILQNGHQIRLLDLYFPPRVSRITREFKNLQLHEIDLTGFKDLGPLYKILLKQPKPPALPIKKDHFVISSNIWSQLPILPIDYLSANTEVGEMEKIHYAKSMQKAHESWLCNFGCPGLIFSDFENHHYDSKDQLVKIEQQPYRPENLTKVHSWDWRWADNVIRKVEAYSISRKAE